jgi:hypothetical protein
MMFPTNSTEPKADHMITLWDKINITTFMHDKEATTGGAIV